MKLPLVFYSYLQTINGSCYTICRMTLQNTEYIKDMINRNFILINELKNKLDILIEKSNLHDKNISSVINNDYQINFNKKDLEKQNSIFILLFIFLLFIILIYKIIFFVNKKRFFTYNIL